MPKSVELQEHYAHLWKESLAKFEKGEFELDPHIDAEEDRRFGITLLARPSPAIKEAFASFIAELLAVEPAQYYYPPLDIHVTVMSVISCYQGFNLSNIQVKAYETLLLEVMQDVQPFKIDFKGITASPSSIMVQGFPEDESLEILRDKIRHCFKNSSLQQTIDRRYAIRTAHCTLVRFREPVLRQQDLLHVVKGYKEFPFGAFEVRELELVYNDWYQRQGLVKLLKKFKL